MSRLAVALLTEFVDGAVNVVSFKANCKRWTLFEEISENKSGHL